MAEIQLLLEFDDEVDTAAAADELREQLGNLEGVEEVETDADRSTVERLDVVETVNSVTAVVTALSLSAGATRLFLERLTEVANSVHGLRRALVRRPDGSTVLVSEASREEIFPSGER